jgi:hypothetical protein
MSTQNWNQFHRHLHLRSHLTLKNQRKNSKKVLRKYSTRFLNSEPTYSLTKAWINMKKCASDQKKQNKHVDR